MNLSGETISPIIRLLQYMQVLSKSDKIKELIAPKMKDLITLNGNNGKTAIYSGEIFMVSTIIWTLLEPQITWLLKVGDINLLVIHI